MPLLKPMAGGALAGAILALGFPPYNLPTLLPFGIAALLYTLRTCTWRQAEHAGLACGLAFFGLTLFWLGGLFGFAAVSLITILAVFVAAFGALYVALQRTFPRIPAWLLAAVVWTAIEYFRSEPFPLNFGWMGLGYALVGVPAFVRVAFGFGSYGITFVVVAIGAAMCWLATRRQYDVLAIVTVAWLGIPWLPDVREGVDEAPKHVALIQANAEDEENLFGLSVPGKGVKPDVIVWPEYSFLSD